jgi:hypothetical protein
MLDDVLDSIEFKLASELPELCEDLGDTDERSEVGLIVEEGLKGDIEIPSTFETADVSTARLPDFL